MGNEPHRLIIHPTQRARSEDCARVVGGIRAYYFASANSDELKAALRPEIEVMLSFVSRGRTPRVEDLR